MVEIPVVDPDPRCVSRINCFSARPHGSRWTSYGRSNGKKEKTKIHVSRGTSFSQCSRLASRHIVKPCDERIYQQLTYYQDKHMFVFLFQMSLDERLHAISIEKPKVKAPPKSDSVLTLLTQGLQSQDTSLLAVSLLYFSQMNRMNSKPNFPFACQFVQCKMSKNVKYFCTFI